MEKNKEGIVIPTGENAEIWRTLSLLNVALEVQLKGVQANTKLLFFAATMTTIAAINSMGGPSVLYKGMIFMVVGLAGYILSRKYIP